MSSQNSIHSLAIWPTLPLNVHFRQPSKWNPFPLDQAGCRIYSLARHAIWNTCRSSGFGPDDVVLVPAYHHGSEIEALLQARLNIRYYKITENLEPDVTNLELLLGPKVKALYLIHYMGFPQNAAFWRHWCDERKLLLIEDAAQAFLSTHNGRPVGSFGHMAFFCLYKTYGIPDGGAVISKYLPPLPGLRAQSGFWEVFKRHVNFVATRSSSVGFIHRLFKPLVTRWKRKWNVLRGQLSKEFELGDPATPPSVMTRRLLPRILDEKTAERRRENYKFLLRHLGHLVPRPFNLLPEGACPFAFPIEVADAREFRKKLHRKGVLGILYWLNPHPSLPVPDFARCRKLRENMLALPVHQELTLSNLQQIVNVVKEVLIAMPQPMDRTQLVFPRQKQDPVS
jgi:hypothetical protein